MAVAEVTEADTKAGGLRLRARQVLTVYGVWAACLGLALPFSFTLGLRIFPNAPPERFSPRARAVAFETADGFTLQGVYAPPRPGYPLLVFQHGVRAARVDVAPWASELAAQGYGLLAFDWRGHGASDGWWIGYGLYEGEDLRAMDAFLDAQPELAGVDRGLVAVSLGASILAQHADQFGPEYRCMLLDSPFGDLRRMVDHNLSPFGPLGWIPKQVMLVVTRLWMGSPVTAIVPEQKLAAFAPRPLMVFHGTLDRTVPFAEGQSLYAAYPGPKERWFTEGDDHTEARITRRSEWMQRAEQFFRAHMAHPDHEADQ